MAEHPGRHWLKIGLLAVAYFAVARLGLTMAFVQPNVTPVWPPTGLALAVLLIGGMRMWPGVFLGAFAVNSLTAVSIPTALGIATGNTLEALLGALLIHRFIGKGRQLDCPVDVIRFVLLGGLMASAVSACVGVASLYVGGYAPAALLSTLWMTWWLGDACGAVIYAPLVLAWASDWNKGVNKGRNAEAIVVAVLLAAITLIAFGPHPYSHYPIAYLPIPLLVWSAFRFRRIGVTTAIFIVTAIANWGTVNGYGSFVEGAPNESLVLLQVYISVVSVSMLMLGALLVQRREADAALERSHALLKSQQEGAIDGILVVDEQHRVLSYNRRFQEIWGIPPALMERLDDKQLLAYVHNALEDPAGFLRKVEHLYDQPLESSQDVVRLKDGRVLDRFSTPARSPQGEVFGRIWYFRDVTERERMESALRQKNQQLTQLDTLKNRFVDTVSHELRTPLTSLIGYAEFLEDRIGGELTAEQEEFVTRIQENGHRLETLVNDLLDFSRLQTGSFYLSCQLADLGQVARSVAASLQPQARKAGLTLEVHAPAEPVVAAMDPGRIGQVIMNLVGNALKFTPEGGHVQVVVSDGDDEVRAVVRDDGKGIPAVHLPHLFDRFYQADPSTTREQGGVGLGLAICKAIVEAHDGHMGVESEEGRGAAFWFALPKAGRPAPTDLATPRA